MAQCSALALGPNTGSTAEIDNKCRGPGSGGWQGTGTVGRLRIQAQMWNLLGLGSAQAPKP